MIPVCEPAVRRDFADRDPSASGVIDIESTANTAGSNVRLRWEYRPDSGLFVVYNEQRDALTPAFPALLNRAVVVKVNRLFRF